MNIKIKASGVYCLVGEDYDKVYSALRKQFGDGDMQIFTERTPGHEYLQWELPGDGWTALSECDPLMSQTVKRELSRRCSEISAKFGANQQMAQKVLSYPDDAYVYYKADNEGRIVIKITAWGYRYPERIGDGPSVGTIDPAAKTERVTVKLLYNGRPMPDKPFKLNGFLRNTGPDGVLEIGDLPTGYQFDIETDKGREHIVVMQGQGDIELDITEYAAVEIRVYSGDNPYGGAVADVQYGGQSCQLVCDAVGRCTVKFPQDPDGGLCVVSVGAQTQQKMLEGPLTVFEFRLDPPKEEAKPEPTDTAVSATDKKEMEDIVPDNGQPRANAAVEVYATVNGEPYSNAFVHMHYKGQEHDFRCDEQGHLSINMPYGDDNEPCYVSVDDQSQSRILKDGVNRFDFDVKKSEEQPRDDDSGKGGSLYGILLAVLLAALVAATYMVCRGLIFG